MLLKSSWHLKNSKFDECVLLWTYAFTLRSIMVSTRLFIKFRKYCISFSEFDFFLILKVMELPSYKIDDNDVESRYIETTIDIKNEVFKIANIYFPNGMPSANYEGVATESERFLYKLNFYDRMKIKMKESLSDDDIVLFGGDYNVMHHEIDVYNPKNWKGQIAFLPEERSRLSDITDMGYTDAFRHLNPDMKEYTWWDYRSGGWQKNYGLRIDYMMLNQYGMSKLKDCHILRETRGWERPSDHAPMICEFDI